MQEGLYIGVMTGTSADGLDVCLCEISPTSFQILDQTSTDFCLSTKDRIRSLCQASYNEIFTSKTLGIELSQLTANLINELINKHHIKASDIMAIGFHGQTVRHQPNGALAFSHQIGCGSTLAHLSKIKVITDFRMADIAAGGQGAPLVPAFHNYIFRSTSTNRFILNIGGIANITCLPKNTNFPITGFDTGPGNTLLDEWILLHQSKRFDFDGNWAKSGSINETLLKLMLKDEYIQRTAPKSTGKELFNLTWLNKLLEKISLDSPENIQRTLLQFTIESICKEIEHHATKFDATQFEVYVCGGGAKNGFLMQQLSERLPKSQVLSTSELGVDPQAVEACAFSWLAFRSLNGLTGNLISATGAKQEKILGCIYFP